MISTFAIFAYLLIGMWIGFMLGINTKESPTDEMNRKRVERENKELELKIKRYKKTIQDLVDDNRRLAAELDKEIKLKEKHADR